MNIAMTTEGGRVAPCFAGVELWIFGPGQQVGEHLTVHTAGREPLLWARDLLRRDVDTLLCAGIDVFVWGVLRGNGIRVVPEAAGPAKEVLARWRAGTLRAPSTWPYPGQRRPRHHPGMRRHRPRGGKRLW